MDVRRKLNCAALALGPSFCHPASFLPTLSLPFVDRGEPASLFPMRAASPPSDARAQTAKYASVGRHGRTTACRRWRPAAPCCPAASASRTIFLCLFPPSPGREHPAPLVLPEVTPATRLLEKRRQQFEADERLEAAKTAYATQVGPGKGASSQVPAGAAGVLDK